MRFVKIFLPMAAALAAFILVLAFSANSTSAQTPSTCTDAAYLRQIKTDIITSLASAQPDNSKPDELSAALVTVIKLRYKEEDADAPVGCESLKATVIKLLGIYEDQTAMRLADLADAPNQATYDGLISDTISTRARGIGADFSAAIGVRLGGGDETELAVATPEATTAGS